MKDRYIIGVDIGGTNTDAVVVDHEKNIIGKTKVPTSANIIDGYEKALMAVLTKVLPDKVASVHVGTTHAVNAILERRSLSKVGVIRLAGHRPGMLPPCCGWPKELQEAILAGFETVDGGKECDGRSITPLNPLQVRQAADRLIAQGAEALAIVGVFSPLAPEQEEEAAELMGGHIPISLSNRLGGMGIVERENAAILNAALTKVMREGFSSLRKSTLQAGLKCPLYFTQNNGSLIHLEQALESPILTLSSGQTNSFIGAAKLAGLSDAVVVDVGGTSTDVGVIAGGFPRKSYGSTHIEGVRLNFPMPDVVSIGLGGGSHIALGRDITVGPRSVGRRLLSDSRAFGGDILTLTDAAIALEHLKIPGGDRARVGMDREAAMKVLEMCLKRISECIRMMQAEKAQLPILLVGGGAALFPAKCFFGRSLSPDSADVANAYGAALAQVTGTADAVVCLDDREKALEGARQAAYKKAVENGAVEDSLKVVDIQIIPYHYMPGNKARVVAMAAGELTPQGT